jgi:hypothetical protein
MNKHPPKTQTCSQGNTPPFRISSVEQLPVLAQEESCRIIKQYFDYLEDTLTQQKQTADIPQLREMLSEISGFIRSDKSQIRADGYLRMLNRLTRIYAKGIHARDDRAFAGTAVNFADIVNTLSHTYPHYDYSESVGLLLYYMNKLFNYREEGWIELYEYLLCLPESLQVMQMLREEYMQEIQNWIEEGVDNLFTIWDEQLEIIQNINGEIALIDNKILANRKTLLKSKHDDFKVNVTSLTTLRTLQLIEQLQSERKQKICERDVKLELAGLLDDNIQEFTNRLTEIRRSTMIQLAWSNPKY